MENGQPKISTNQKFQKQKINKCLLIPYNLYRILTINKY